MQIRHLRNSLIGGKAIKQFAALTMVAHQVQWKLRGH